MPNKPKITFTYGYFAVEGFDVDGTVATFTGPAAGSAGAQYVDWLAHSPGTELEDLRVAVNEITGALCNYCNNVGDPYDPPSEWDETCKSAFESLCEAYNSWHKNHKNVGEISRKFWSGFESELYQTKEKLREAEREREGLILVLQNIAGLKSEPIADSGFATGPLALFNIAQRIARENLKKFKARNAALPQS